MKCIVLNFKKKECLIFPIKEDDNIEEVLTKEHKLDLFGIEFIVVEDDALKIK